jgi:hypothetical protein
LVPLWIRLYTRVGESEYSAAKIVSWMNTFIMDDVPSKLHQLFYFSVTLHTSFNCIEKQDLKRSCFSIQLSNFCAAGATAQQVLLTRGLNDHQKMRGCTVYFLAHFCPVAFFPPNDRSQNHAQENPLLVLFLLAQKCLWTLNMEKYGKNIYFFE